jgi:osmotically-inducible protein OsmY
MSTRYDDWDDSGRYDREDRGSRRDWGRSSSRDDWRGSDARSRYRDEYSERQRRTGGMMSRDYGGYGTGPTGSRAGYRGGYDDYDTGETSDWARRDTDLTINRAPGRYGEERPGMYGSRYDYERSERQGYDRGYDPNAYGYRSDDRQREGREMRGGDRGFWDRASDEVASWFGDQEAERRRQMDAQRDARTRHGGHVGRGPKGYRRSDERIREDVNDRLTDHAYLDATEIEVSVSDGIVTLSGSAESRSAKRLAEDLAESVSGVRDVNNNIRVSRGWETTSSTTPASTTATGAQASTSMTTGTTSSATGGTSSRTSPTS